MDEWMDEGTNFGLRSSFTRTKITNPGITLQMDICTRPCVCLADLAEIRIPDTVRGRMLQIKAQGRKLNCQTDGAGGRGGCILDWGPACANATLNGTHSVYGRLFFVCTCHQCDVLLGGAPVLRSGIYIKDKPRVQRLQMMISLINDSKDITTGQGHFSVTRVRQEGDNKRLFMMISLFDVGLQRLLPNSWS